MLAGNIKYKAKLYKLIPETANNNEYEYYKTVNAQLHYKTGNQVIQAFQIFDKKHITIKIRNRKDIDETMLVKIGNEVFDIIYIQTIGGFTGDILIDLVSSNRTDLLSDES